LDVDDSRLGKIKRSKLRKKLTLYLPVVIVREGVGRRERRVGAVAGHLGCEAVNIIAAPTKSVNLVNLKKCHDALYSAAFLP
jgi:hypothetical protein